MLNAAFVLVGLAGLFFAANQWHGNNLLQAELAQLSRLAAAHPRSPASGQPLPVAAPVSPTPDPTASGEPILTLPLDPRLKPGLVPVGLLENRGNATPYAAFETVQWALAHHDLETLQGLLGATKRDESLLDGLHGFNREEIIAAHEMNSGAFSNAIGMEIDTQAQLDGDRIYLSGHVQLANGGVHNFDIVVGRTPTGWKWFNGAGGAGFKEALGK